MLLKVLACTCLLAGVLTEDLPPEKTCGTQVADNDVSGGKNASLREFPWIALLRYEDEDGENAGFRCLGSLIGPKYVLTAAICATPVEVKLKGVVLGEHELTTDPDCAKGGAGDCADALQRFNVEKVVVHESYDLENSNNDIALIKLDKDVKITDFVRPICLPLPDYKAKPGDETIASGWGRTITGELMTTKKKVLSSIITNEDCSKDYSKSSKKILDSHLCTRAHRNNTAFTCAGDTGGPLMLFKDDRWYQEGIVSFGIGCGYMLADGNIRVENYLDWINKKVDTI